MTKAEKQLAVSFSGHRKERITKGRGIHIIDQIRLDVIANVTLLYAQGYKTFYNGMANGFDLITAEAVLRVKQCFKDIRLVAVIPFREQAERYDAADKATYRKVLRMADEVVVVSERYFKGCFFRRNDYMIRRSDKIVAYWDGEHKGGTYYTAKQAEKLNIEFINLYKA